MTELMRAHAGAEHLNGRSRDQRRDLGQVYTPDWLVRFVLDQALGRSDEDDERGRVLHGPVLDPSCGSGAFLVGLVDELAEQWLAAGKKLTGRGGSPFVAMLTEQIFGLDVDELAVEIARAEVADAVNRVTGLEITPDRFEANVRVGDFLWQPLESFGFPTPRLVVGNPPYVTADRIGAEEKRRFRAAFSTAFGRLDLYTLFMEKSARLSKDGSFAFITPDKYLSSQSAGPLRDLLVSLGAVDSICLFDSHRVFEKAAIVPCVTVWRGASNIADPHERFMRFDRVSHVPGATSYEIEERREVGSEHLHASTWNFQRSRHESLEERIVAGHVYLGDSTTRISAGVTTGLNEAFLLDRDAAAALEPELVHPTVGGRHIHANRITADDRFMLVPCVWDGEVPHLIDLDDFPRARAWLAQHRRALEQRHCVRVWEKKWWDLHDPVGLPLHRTEKVLVPDLARSNRFAADAGTYLPQHSAYYIIGHDLPADILAAVLNSEAVEFLVRSRAPRVKDGFSRYRAQFLKTLPVPKIDEDTQLRMRHALANHEDDDLADITAGLFGVDKTEIQMALMALAPGRSGSSSATARARGVSPSGQAASK